MVESRPVKKLKLISCEIFYREMCAAVSRSPNRIDVQFLPKGLHDIGSKEMLARLQDAVDTVDSDSYEAVLLGYGLCNNGLSGIEAKVLPLVLPRAHDCITLFMGSSEKYIQYFNDHPGVYFETTGWLERGKGTEQLKDLSVQNKTGMDLTYEELVEKYGEDNAQYLYEELRGNERGYKQITFIEMGVESDKRFENQASEEAKKRGWQFEKMKGDLSMIERLVDGDWNEKEFLVVQPGHRISAHYGESLDLCRKDRERGSMTGKVKIDLLPVGESLEVPSGTELRDVLFDRGVEFPCGGHGECRGCRVRVIKGSLPLSDLQNELLSEKEIEEGWRVSCQCRADCDLTLELRGWNADILQDRTSFKFTPGEGWGVAVDVGTTTIAVQLLDLTTSKVLGVRSALNTQARHGADVMSRIAYGLSEGGLEVLRDSIRKHIGTLINDLIQKSDIPHGAKGSVREVTLVGNTAMHHLFCGIDVEPLSAYPFETSEDGTKNFTCTDLGWGFSDTSSIRFLHCLGGFVGSDLLAGLLATQIHTSPDPCALIDLGTNGEIIVAAGERILCASTAAGPAFEGARIKHGMRAAHGAIHRVEPTENGYRCQVLGNTEARGICGSGLVDAVAAGLEKGDILPNGRVADGSKEVSLTENVSIRQCDIRQLQLAKGAIAAGVRILCKEAGFGTEQLRKVYLAGAFGNYINHASAERIGLLNFPADKIHPVGNSALLGAKMALFDTIRRNAEIQSILARTEHLTLSSDPDFQDIYADEMGFPSNTLIP